MADNETSKITWIAITVALASSIYGISSGKLPTLAETTFSKVHTVVDSIGSKTEPVTMPDSNDAKWVEKGNFGDNGYFVRDADGNGVVYALDTAKPVLAPTTADAGKKFVSYNTSLKTLKFLSETVLPSNSSAYFRSNDSLTSFSSKNLDTSNVTQMAGMFRDNYLLTSLDVSNFNTTKVTGMSTMFSDDRSLTALDVSNFDTSNVMNMSSMFSGAEALTSLDISHFDTSKVVNMYNMFYGDRSLTSLDLSHFNTSNVTEMSNMFSGNSALTSLDLSNFDTSKVKATSKMFSGDKALKTLNLSNFDMSNVTGTTNASNMFSGLSKLETVNLANVKASPIRSDSAFTSNPEDLNATLKTQIANALFTDN